MRWRLVDLAIAAAMLLPGVAMAQSTINTSIPAANAPLQSAPIRGNFVAAASDINNIVAMHPSASLSACPSPAYVGEDCLVTASSPFLWYKYMTAGWQEIGTFSPAFSPILGSDSIVADSPLTASFAGGAYTLGLGTVPVSLGGTGQTTAGAAAANAIGALAQASNLSDLSSIATAVNNLFGASSTGSGGAVRAAGPTVASLTVDTSLTSDNYACSSNCAEAIGGTSYTLSATDNGKIATTSSGSPMTITVPSGLPVGFSWIVTQGGAGEVGFVAAGGVTINSPAGDLHIGAQNGTVTIFSPSSNVFTLGGYLQP